jgi:hypothetical protein
MAPNFPVHLFEYLGISRKVFYEKAGPTSATRGEHGTRTKVNG